MIPFKHLGWGFKRFGSIIYPRSVQESLCHFIEYLPKNAKVLDLGAGTGMMSEFAYACRKDMDYIALDPSLG